MLKKILAQIDINPEDLELPMPNVADRDESVATILQLTFGILGAVAFLVIVIAGMQFVLSRGNAEKSAKARNAIIYAAVGLVIAVLAFSIVRFVTERVG